LSVLGTPSNLPLSSFRRRLLGAFIEVDEHRFGYQDIRELYDNADYPLKRALN